ncbi:efflux RND transporter periplasmic adaptor subunit [Candidatus Dependentiae bacterium]
MNIKKLLTIFFVISVTIILSWFLYKKFFIKKEVLPFKTQTAEKRDIYKIVNAEGYLEAIGYSKIGPLIQGTVKSIFVKEGQSVKKGDVLAELDNGVGGNTLVREKEAVLQKAKATFDYFNANYQRQKALYDTGQISKDAFQGFTKEYLNAKSDVKLAQANLDKETFVYENTKVKATADGVILSIPIELGQAVATIASPPSVLFEIVQNLNIMRAKLKIEENRIGDIHVGQKVKIKVDTYPYKVWKGEIKTVANSSILTQSGTVSYKTVVKVNNEKKLLKPGMTVHAKITTAKVKNVLALPGFIFQVNDKAVEVIAKKLKYEFKPLDPKEKKKLSKQETPPIKFVWVVKDKVFVQKTVEIGLTDYGYFQIISGINEKDKIISDIESTDEMKELYKKFFGGGL